MKAVEKKPRRSLDEYAKEHPERRSLVCWVCALPPDIRKAVNDGKRQGRLIPTIINWLVEDCGYTRTEARPGRFAGHFQRGHDRQ